MKKIYSFLTLMLLFVMGINTVAAQEESRWDIGDALTEPPVPGQQFVLRRGFNTSWGGAPAT